VDVGIPAEIQEKKALLQKEIDEAQEELNRLKAERNHSISNFGAEIEQIHAKKTMESEALANRLQRDCSALEQLKTEKETELAALDQQKMVEWAKVQSELSRYKAEQLMELETQKEKKLSAAAAELNALLLEQQAARDAIELLQYDYEKAKAENVVKLERTKMEELRALENARAESRFQQQQALAEFETKKSNLTSEINLLSSKLEAAKAEFDTKLETHKADEMKRIDEHRLALFQEVNRELDEARKARQDILHDVELLKSEGMLLKTANGQEAERFRVEKIREAEEQKLKNLREVEALRQEWLDKLDALQRTVLERQEEVSELARRRELLVYEIAEQKSRLLTELETHKINEMDYIARLKLDKLKETEEYLERYREERLRQIQTELDNKEASGTKRKWGLK
jgi:hypothetical protein